MKGLIEGRIVHYILAEGDPNYSISPSHHNAAIVIYVDDAREGYVRLYVFDHRHSEGIACWADYSNQRLPGTWHWPEKV